MISLEPHDVFRVRKVWLQCELTQKTRFITQSLFHVGLRMLSQSVLVSFGL